MELFVKFESQSNYGRNACKFPMMIKKDYLILSIFIKHWLFSSTIKAHYNDLIVSTPYRSDTIFICSTVFSQWTVVDWFIYPRKFYADFWMTRFWITYREITEKLVSAPNSVIPLPILYNLPISSVTAFDHQLLEVQLLTVGQLLTLLIYSDVLIDFYKIAPKRTSDKINWSTEFSLTTSFSCHAALYGNLDDPEVYENNATCANKLQKLIFTIRYHIFLSNWPRCLTILGHKISVR